MASGLSESASKTPRQRSSCLGCTNGSIFMYIHKNAWSVKQYSSLTPTQNVRFRANFLTEPGIIIKRSQTRSSAKAQRKVGRMIKIARAFGLMPFTMMVTIPFVFGKTVEDLDEDYKFDDYDYTRLPVDTNAKEDPVLDL
ncbi:uncharacterized protein LOC143879384 isoform X2 [Tasmannia lanceolata]|uniref:uncharacterized protein LOC143879384 isoform X2 n=1 Tax=Tasmannia lanceolata TaxID=3420 RepID=UPI0040648BDA